MEEAHHLNFHHQATCQVQTAEQKQRDPLAPAKVLLLVDNAAVHSTRLPDIIPEHLTIVFLPPNTTSLIQPMDQTCIRTFKSKYTKLLMHQLVRQEDVTKFLDGFSLKEAIPLMDEAWRDVQATTMKKSWHKLLPWAEGYESHTAKAMAEIEEEIEKLSLKHKQTLREYILDIEEDICDLVSLTDEEIEMVKGDPSKMVAKMSEIKEAYAKCQQREKSLGAAIESLDDLDLSHSTVDENSPGEISLLPSPSSQSSPGSWSSKAIRSIHDISNTIANTSNKQAKQLGTTAMYFTSKLLNCYANMLYIIVSNDIKNK